MAWLMKNLSIQSKGTDVLPCVISVCVCVCVCVSELSMYASCAPCSAVNAVEVLVHETVNQPLNVCYFG